MAHEGYPLAPVGRGVVAVSRLVVYLVGADIDIHPLTVYGGGGSLGTDLPLLRPDSILVTTVRSAVAGVDDEDGIDIVVAVAVVVGEVDVILRVSQSAGFGDEFAEV